MRNFDTELDVLGVKRIVTTTQSVKVIEEVTVTKLPKKSGIPRLFVGKPDDQWTWRDLRDYVSQETKVRGGGWAADPLKEAGIFKGFLNRWGNKAPKIARYAFTQCDGKWLGQVIELPRFMKANDPYFAQPISEKLGDETIQAW